MADFDHNLLVHPRTEGQIRLFLSRPAHALLLVGPVGSGKYTLAQNIAANLLRLDSAARLQAYPHYLELNVTDGKQEIPIDDIRGLIAKLRLKTLGEATLRRVILVDGAQYLSAEAQNAFLKTLEEPASDTVFILTASSAKAVAPTVASRAQAIAVHPVTDAAAQKFYASRFNQAEVNSNWLLSAGTAGLLDSLLKIDVNHPLKEAVVSFKKFLGLTEYERLLFCDTLSRDKAAFGYFLDGGKRILRALHQSSIRGGQAKRATALNNGRKLLNSLQEGLEANASPKLLALALALNLKI